VQSYYHRQIYTFCYLLAAAWPLFYGTDFLQENVLLCATWALACAAMSVFTLLPAIKVEDSNMMYVDLTVDQSTRLTLDSPSLLGGFLILLVGVVYLAFEKELLLQSSPSISKKVAAVEVSEDGVSRIILGAQVGLVALAMVVTRSSVASLQAKQGLPLGTQVVGWATLSELLFFFFFLQTPILCLCMIWTGHIHSGIILHLVSFCFRTSTRTNVDPQPPYGLREDCEHLRARC
jgi:phosphatidylinositol glycan class N